MRLARQTFILSTAAALLMLLGACAKPAAHRLGGDANHPYGASDDNSPSAQDEAADDEDALLDRLFHDAPTGRAPRRQTTPPSSTTTAPKPNETPPSSGAPSAGASNPLPPSLNPNTPPEQIDTEEPTLDDEAAPASDASTTPASNAQPPAVPRELPAPPIEESQPEKTPDDKSNSLPNAQPKPAPTPTPMPTPRLPSQPATQPKPRATPPRSAVESAPISALWDDRVSEGRHWTNMTIRALSSYGHSLLTKVPDDIQNFCPNFANLGIHGRADFWVKLISAITAAESHFDPADSYTEKSFDRNGDNVVSRGLLQLSLESVQAYKCNISSQADLEDPQKNLECGVKILNKWIGEDGVITAHENSTWLGGARYWSTLRPYNNKYETIRQLVRKSPVCKTPK